jgi:hypothetical protein
VTIARHDAPLRDPGRSSKRSRSAPRLPLAAADALAVDGGRRGVGGRTVPGDRAPDWSYRSALARALEHQVTPLGAPDLLERVDRLAAVGASAMLLGLMSRSLK